MLTKLFSNKLLALLGILAVVAVLGDAWHAGRDLWRNWRRPYAPYITVMPNGVAISLNGLLKAGNVGTLPIADGVC